MVSLLAKRVAVIRGDGTGPELIKTTLLVMDAARTELDLIMCEGGYEGWQQNGGGSFLPPETWSTLQESDACLKGPTITPTALGEPRSVAVGIRQRFDLYANVRPIKEFSTRKSDKRVDFICVREGTEGMYSGIGYRLDKDTAINIRKTTRKACKRVSHFAFREAREKGWKTVVAIHKANIMRETDGLFLEAVEEVSEEYAEIALEEYLIDNMAQQLMKNPERFNQKVLLSTNLFMDIISEEASGLVGSIGTISSANLGDSFAMFEPAHGSSPKYKGKNTVNPTATILSAAWMLRFLGEKKAGDAISLATENVIMKGNHTTYDLGGVGGTSEMGEAIAEEVRAIIHD